MANRRQPAQTLLGIRRALVYNLLRFHYHICKPERVHRGLVGRSEQYQAIANCPVCRRPVGSGVGWIVAELGHFHHTCWIVVDGFYNQLAVGGVDGVATRGGKIEALHCWVGVFDDRRRYGVFVQGGVRSLFKAFGWGRLCGYYHEDGKGNDCNHNEPRPLYRGLFYGRHDWRKH